MRYRKIQVKSNSFFFKKTFLSNKGKNLEVKLKFES